MSNPAALAALEYESEGGTWGADVTTFATHRIPIITALDVSGLVHTKVDGERVVQLRNDGTQWVLMTMGGSFKTKLDLTGHGTTTSGATTIDALETFLGFVFGASALSAASGTTLTAGTAAAPTTTASGTFVGGSLCRIGTLGDGRGNGQFYPIGTHAATTLNLLTAMDGAPSNGDVLFSAATISTPETPTATTITGLRFRALTANLRYEMHGCFPMSVAFTGLNPGERPQVEVTWGVSWWRYTTATFPSVVASNIYNPGPVAAGSLSVADVGTTTRSKRTCRAFSIEYTLGVVPLMGPGGASAFQAIVGATRTPDSIKVKWTEDADAATVTPVLPGFATAQTFKHAIYTLSTAPGSAVGFYFPRMAVSAVPLQMNDGNINRLAFEAMAYSGATNTTDLTSSAFRMGYA